MMSQEKTLHAELLDLQTRIKELAAAHEKEIEKTQYQAGTYYKDGKIVVNMVKLKSTINGLIEGADEAIAIYDDAHGLSDADEDDDCYPYDYDEARKDYYASVI